MPIYYAWLFNELRYWHTICFIIGATPGNPFPKALTMNSMSAIDQLLYAFCRMVWQDFRIEVMVYQITDQLAFCANTDNVTGRVDFTKHLRALTVEPFRFEEIPHFDAPDADKASINQWVAIVRADYQPRTKLNLAPAHAWAKALIAAYRLTLDDGKI